MAYRTERTSQADSDLETLFDYFVTTNLGFGYSKAEAFSRAEDRAEVLEQDMAALALAPHQGTLQPWIGAGVRHVTKDKAIFYFAVDDSEAVVRILAIFYGGQDHKTQMRKRRR